MSYDRLLAWRKDRDAEREREAEHDRAFREAILKAREAGMSFSQIARVVGLSKQRVHQMVSGR